MSQNFLFAINNTFSHQCSNVFLFGITRLRLSQELIKNRLLSQKQLHVGLTHYFNNVQSILLNVYGIRAHKTGCSKTPTTLTEKNNRPTSWAQFGEYIKKCLSLNNLAFGIGANIFFYLLKLLKPKRNLKEARITVPQFSPTKVWNVEAWADKLVRWLIFKVKIKIYPPHV